MSKSPEFQGIVRELEAAIEVFFRKLVKDRMQEHGDDLAMIGLCSSSGLEYLSPVEAIHSTLEEDAIRTLGEVVHPILCNTLWVYYAVPEVDMTEVDRLMTTLYDFCDEPNWRQAIYDGIISGMKRVEANKLIGSEFADASRMVAFVIGGADRGSKNMISALNSNELAEHLFPTPSYILDGTLREIGRKSGWANPWSASFVLQDRNRILCTSRNNLFEMELVTGEISQLARSQCVKICATSVAADRKTMVSISSSELEYWQLAPRVESLWKTEVGYQATTVSIEPTGKHAVIGFYSGPALIWDLTQNKEVIRLSHGDSGHGVMACSWSKDGRIIATSGRDLSLRLWDGHSFALLDEVPFGGDIVQFVPNKNLIAVAQGHSESPLSPLRFWDYVNRDWKAFLPGVTKNCCSIAIREDGERFVVGSSPYSGASLFDADGKEIASIDVEINEPAFLEDGSVLFSWDALGEPGGPFAIWKCCAPPEE